MSLSARLAGAVLLAAVLVSGARAEDCRPLSIYTSVDLVRRGGDTRMYVPVSINGTPKFMLLDTGGSMSAITRQATNEFQLSTRQLGFQEVDVSGATSDQAADVAEFDIGQLRARSIEFVVMPDQRTFGDPRYVGIVGSNILKKYDVDIDFGASKLSLLSQDHCEGKVIYWPASAVAVVDMRLSRSGHIVIPVRLDGKAVSATLDTGAFETTLSYAAAESDFGLKMGSPETPQSGYLFGKAGVEIYRHRFASLDFDGLAVGNLDVTILPDLVKDKYQPGPEIGTRLSDSSEASDYTDMLIGMNVLRHLHIYIAYKEKKLYITPASAPASPH